jgi:cytochrome bd-type quinol oxidase subunit 1/cytochrome c551/c552
MNPDQLHGIIFPILGNSRVMALTIVTHVFFAFIAVGSFYIALIAEYRGYKHNQPIYDRMAKGYMTFIAQMVKINGVLGVAIIVLFISLFPIFSGWLYTILFWALFGEVIFFMILMSSSIWYRQTWDKYQNRKPVHFAIGIICAIAAAMSAVLINAAQAFMLTPGKYFESKNFYDAAFNPTMFPSTLHLLIPCILNAAAAYALFAYVQSQRKPVDREYYNITGAYSARIAAWVVLLQPPAGLYYLWVVYHANRPAFQNIISGLASPFFWTMASLGSIAFILSIIYLFLGWIRGKNLFLIIAILVLAAFPFGAYNRERARKPYLIYGKMYMSQQTVSAPVVKPIETTSTTSVSTTATPGTTTEKSKPATAKSGETIISEHGCRACHTIKGQGGSFGPKLHDLNKKFDGDKEKVKKFLLSPPPAMPPFAGPTGDLDSLAEYLLKL